MTASLQNTPFVRLPNGLAIVEILYYLPDRPLLLGQPFTWQTLDYFPEFPRVRMFLDFWAANIDAPIRDILLAHPLLPKKTDIRELPKVLH
ncbi:hypothetical protein H0X32_01490 [Patescibacteria group bacterium]|nr:hypothetical protein [Patescibacteria group bacterium]